jgi:hypothetical protein
MAADGNAYSGEHIRAKHYIGKLSSYWVIFDPG